MNVAMQKNRPLIQYSVIFSLVCLLGIAPVSQARMYKWVDADGNTSKLVIAMGDAYARQQGVEHNVRNLSNKEFRFTEVE